MPVAVDRWPLAGWVIFAAVAAVVLLRLAKRLPKHDEERAVRNVLLSIAGVALPILLVVDIIFVVEGIAHLIWPSFVDYGS